jgi:hypothetical protein
MSEGESLVFYLKFVVTPASADAVHIVVGLAATEIAMLDLWLIIVGGFAHLHHKDIDIAQPRIGVLAIFPSKGTCNKKTSFFKKKFQNYSKTSNFVEKLHYSMQGSTMGQSNNQEGGKPIVKEEALT